ncbi:MAG: DUF1592 domain-containing protein [Planctomycetota bacterium]|nr:DUF1592 domain-containing protein [Planctomycetota bacterium]
MLVVNREPGKNANAGWTQLNVSARAGSRPGNYLAIFILGLTWFSSLANADEFPKQLDAFVQANCIDCHDESTDTRLDFSKLKRNLSDPKGFRHWVKIFDRTTDGEMPPPDADQPLQADRQNFLSRLRKELTTVNRKKQETRGRVPLRRLSRKEYEHTLHDLLGIGGSLAKYLPAENTGGSFDVVAAKQEMSSVHVQGFLKAANEALDELIQLGRNPGLRVRKLDYLNSKYFQMWIDRPLRMGGGTVFKTDSYVVTFRGHNYVMRSDANGFRAPVAGNYRIQFEAAPHNQRTSITVSLKRQNDKQGDSELFAAWDLDDRKFRKLETVKYLRPDDYFYVSADELDPAPNGKIIYNSQPAKDFKGEGVKVRNVTVEGPLETSWPPERTQKLFVGMKLKPTLEFRRLMSTYKPVLVKEPIEHVREIVSMIARQAFRREVHREEIEQLVSLAKPSLEQGRDFVETLRVPLRAILVSPELILLKGEPGSLDDRSLASRLSYFLWRSLPDAELSEIAADRRLSHSEMLTTQVDRMLADPKSSRFVNDFLDQWLGLDRIDSTTPDAFLYPEYDDVLRRAMLAETREVFRHLIDENLGIENLIDSKFTFLNRRLAEHYGIEGVTGENIRKVKLGKNSPRGGILAHASIAKITANGTVTTPVKRGSFVLTNLLGLPPNPPPPGIESIEPDTRGAATIRETLMKHQAVESCAQCHRRIDPPGFAMECFDPVGNFRNRYRDSIGVDREVNPGLRLPVKEYRLGKKVDTSGITSDGEKFSGIRQYKKQLLKSKKQIARNLVVKLVEFSSGGEIEFGDRDEIERILDQTQGSGYPLRSVIQQVVLSRIFRSR